MKHPSPLSDISRLSRWMAGQERIFCFDGPDEHIRRALLAQEPPWVETLDIDVMAVLFRGSSHGNLWEPKSHGNFPGKRWQVLR